MKRFLPISILFVFLFLCGSFKIFAGGLMTSNGFMNFFNNPSNTKNIDKEVVKLIDSANSTLYIAVFDMNRQIILDAIKGRKKAGVDVRVITDNNEYAKALYHPAYQQLEDSGIVVKTDNRSALMHDKFIVVDGIEILSGSYNFTDGQTTDDKNNIVIIHSSGLAKRYTDEFMDMWNGNFGSAKTDHSGMNTVAGAKVYVKFSPKANVISSILYHLNTADVSVYFNIYAFTDDKIADKLIELHNNGVNVKGTVDAFNSLSQYSRYQKLLDAGIPVKKDNYSGLLHDKFMAIDCGTSSTPKVVTGSFNWTTSADNSNDENCLIIYDANTVGRSYKGNAVYVYSYKAKPVGE